MIAALYERVGVARIFLEYQEIATGINDCTHTKDTALILAAQSGNTGMIKFLLEVKDLDVNMVNERWSALGICEGGNTALMAVRAVGM